MNAVPYAVVDIDTDVNGRPVWVATIHRPDRARAEVVTASSRAILAARLRHRGVADLNGMR